ncbi:alanyl-tRNA editing protein AlaXM [soil metagenome]
MIEGVGATEEIALTDAYRSSIEATVADASQEGVVLDRTVFHPRGGGQPGDTGVLRWSGGEAIVTDTLRSAGRVMHVLQGYGPATGSVVSAEIDWERRYRLMKTHTALHALSGIVWRDHGAKVTGGNMEPGAARMDFELDSVSGDFGREVELRLNDALREGRPVRVRFLRRAEAASDPDLIRTKVNLIPETVDPIRVIEIEGLDRQADGGTHVGNTWEVGPVRVVKTENKGRTFKRMRIELAET